MIAELRGTVARARDESLVVRVEGTGLCLEVTVPRRAMASPGTDVTLHTQLQIGSDGPILAGFETPEELDVYAHMLNVNGVGPRMAVRVLSTHPVRRIIEALDHEDPAPFQAVPGIGKKLANRIILELRGRLVLEGGTELGSADDGVTEALEALLGLGYTRAEAAFALNQSTGEDLPVEERIALALRDLGRRAMR